jgi:hypothetical protein
MSTSEKTQEGDTVRVKVRSLNQILDHPIPKSVAFQFGLLDAGTVLQVVIEPEVSARLFGMLLTSTVAVGADLGPFAKGSGAKVLYVSGAGDEEADQHRLQSIFNGFEKEQQEKLATSFAMYHRGMEGDDQIDLTTEKGREVLMKIIDYLPAFFPTETIQRKVREKLYSWFNDLCNHGMTIVVFDVETKMRTMSGERRAKNTIYLEHDITAPTQFGGGHLLRRSRFDDADSMPKCISFWYTEVDGKLAYGFSVPDDEDRDAPHLTKRLERQMKVASMRDKGMSQKTIAEELEVHAATICRDLKEIDFEAARAEKAKAKSSRPQPESNNGVDAR